MNPKDTSPISQPIPPILPPQPGQPPPPPPVPADQPVVVTIPSLGPCALPPLSGYSVSMIISGLEIPNQAASKSMAREIQQWRLEYPDKVWGFSAWPSMPIGSSIPPFNLSPVGDDGGADEAMDGKSHQP